MILWTGWGILAIVIFLAIGAPMQLFVESSFGAAYYKAHSWPGVLACLMAAPPIWFIGRWLNREQIESTDEFRQTGRHTFFFIPMEYWALVVLALGVFYVFDKPSF